MKKRYIILLIFVVFLILGMSWWIRGSSPANPNDTSQKVFLVAKGSSVRQIANNLNREGLIKDPTIFFLIVKRLGLDGKIQAGDFKLSASQTPTQIAKSLTTGMLDIWITIPEGWRADEIADLLKEKIPDYNESWRPTLEAEEGYLFPDTYLIPRDATSDQIVSIMKNNFDQKYQDLANKYSSNYSQKQIVTIASLIEREARTADDQQLVGSVIMNRLNDGMPLQIDATVQYVLGYQQDTHRWWKKDLTNDDLAINSPYNTYKNPGLPPGPIANPGLGALTAVMNPTKSGYLYYISDKQGHNHYATTLAEHNANIKKYGL